MKRARNLGGPNFIWIVFMTAAISASSSAFCVQVGIAPWLMFLGWSTYVTGNGDAKAGWWSGACALLGVPLGVVGAIFLASVDALGPFALILTVFILTSMAVLSTLMPPLNSPVGWFLGLLGYFGSGLKPELASIVLVASPIFLGLLSGWVASILAAKVAAIGSHSRRLRERALNDPFSTEDPMTRA
jgi:hypothetical protein